MSITVDPGRVDPIIIGIGKPDIIDIEVGTTGKQGPKGPEGGTPVVPIPYDEWPPVDPQPDTLYLRLAP